MSTLLYIMTTIRCGLLLTPIIMMTLNDLECQIHLKVRLSDGTLDVRILWLSELTMRDGMNTGPSGHNVIDKNVANKL